MPSACATPVASRRSSVSSLIVVSLSNLPIPRQERSPGTNAGEPKNGLIAIEGVADLSPSAEGFNKEAHRPGVMWPVDKTGALAEDAPGREIDGAWVNIRLLLCNRAGGNVIPTTQHLGAGLRTERMTRWPSRSSGRTRRGWVLAPSPTDTQRMEMHQLPVPGRLDRPLDRTQKGFFLYSCGNYSPAIAICASQAIDYFL
jgi:hypothetical protein